MADQGVEPPGRRAVRGRLEQVAQEVRRDAPGSRASPAPGAGRVDAGRQVDPVGHLVRPAAVGVPRVLRRRRVGVRRLEEPAGQGRAGAVRLPAARQEAVVLHRLAAADEAGRELALRVPQQRLVDLHLVRRRDHLVVRLVLLLGRSPGRGRRTPSAAACRRRRRARPSSFVRPDAQTTCSGSPVRRRADDRQLQERAAEADAAREAMARLVRDDARGPSAGPGPSRVGRHVDTSATSSRAVRAMAVDRVLGVPRSSRS